MAELRETPEPGIPELSVSKDLYPRYLESLEFFRKYVSPYVNPEKPMLYPASGAALADFIGCNVNEAYFIDPVYNTYNTPDGKTRPNGLDALIGYVSQLDQFVSFQLTPPTKRLNPSEIEGVINFTDSGRKKSIYVIGKNAVGFIPKAIKEKGCSVFVSVGHYVPDLHLPLIQADTYVTPHISPETLGYYDVVVTRTPSKLLSVARGFRKTVLDDETLQLIISKNDTALVDQIAEDIRIGNEKKVKDFLARRLGPEQSRGKTLEEILIMFFRDGFFAPLKSLNSQVRLVWVKDFGNYIRELFDVDHPYSQTAHAGKSILEALKQLTV